MTPTPSEEIKTAIRSANTEKALKILTLHIDEDFGSLLSGQYSRTKKLRLNGHINTDDYDIKINIINSRILTKLEGLEKDFLFVGVENSSTANRNNPDPDLIDDTLIFKLEAFLLMNKKYVPASEIEVNIHLLSYFYLKDKVMLFEDFMSQLQRLDGESGKFKTESGKLVKALEQAIKPVLDVFEKSKNDKNKLYRDTLNLQQEIQLVKKSYLKLLKKQDNYTNEKFKGRDLSRLKIALRSFIDHLDDKQRVAESYSLN